MKYYFTGTLSQLLERLEGFDKQGEFRDGEKTYVIVVDEEVGEPQVDEVKEAEKLNNPLPEKDDSAEGPATDSVAENGKKKSTKTEVTDAEQESQTDDTAKG